MSVCAELLQIKMSSVCPHRIRNESTKKAEKLDPARNEPGKFLVKYCSRWR